MKIVFLYDQVLHYKIITFHRARESCIKLFCGAWTGPVPGELTGRDATGDGVSFSSLDLMRSCLCGLCIKIKWCTVSQLHIIRSAGTETALHWLHCSLQFITKIIVLLFYLSRVTLALMRAAVFTSHFMYHSTKSTSARSCPLSLRNWLTSREKY